MSCPHCNGTHLGKAGKSAKGLQRYFCKNDACKINTFMLEYTYKAYEAGVKDKIIDMAINGNGIRDTSRVLGIHKETIINHLINHLKKKKAV